jgi:hypothetical protein
VCSSDLKERNDFNDDDFLSIHHITRGGFKETELKELTVIPV